MAFCVKCGQQLEEQVKFCSHCGQPSEMAGRFESAAGMNQQSEPISQQAGYQLPMQPEMNDARQARSETRGGYQVPGQAEAVAAVVSSGFSARTQDPAFRSFINKQKKYSWIFLAVLAAAALIAIFIFARDDLGMALLTWAVVILLSAVLNIFGRRKEKKSWDGVLEDRRIVTQYDRGDEHNPGQVKHIPTLYFRTAEGKKEKVQLSYNSDAYDYYQVGDQVRKHASYGYPEKFHKGETIICVYCGKVISRHTPHCPRCKLLAIV